MKNYTKEILLAVFFSVIFALIFTYPAILHINSSYIGDGGDNYEYASYVKLVTHNISEGLMPYSYTNFWRYPQGFNFFLGSDSYLMTLSSGVIAIFIGSVAAYNLVILLLLTLNGLLSYLFFRSLTNSKTLGILGMLIYGFSFNALTKISGHVNLVFNGGFALFAFSILYLIKTQKLKYFLLSLFSVFLIALGSTEYLFMFLLFVPLYLLIGAFMFREKLQSLFQSLWNNKNKITFFLLAFGCLLTIFYLPHIIAALSNQIVLPNRQEILKYSTPSITDYFLPNSYMRFLIGNFSKNPSFSSIERSVFFGWIELVLFILFFFARIPKKLKAFIFICFALPFVLSLGYGKDDSFFLLPYRFLSHTFPFKTVVQTGRYVVIAYFFSTVAIVLLLKSFMGKKIGITIGILILLLIFAERLPNNIYLSDTLENKAYYKAVAAQNSAAVLDLPVDIYQRKYDLASFFYNKPIVNGYFHYLGDGEKQQEFILKDYLLSRYSCSLKDPISKNGLDEYTEQAKDQEMLSLLKKYDISTIVIHKDEKYNFPDCKNVRMRVDRLLYSLQQLPITTAEQKIFAQRENINPTFSFYFPQKGVFFIDGVILFPTKQNYKITLNGKPVSFSYKFVENVEHKTFEIEPKYQINTKVEEGSVITFTSNKIADYSRLDLWYQYFSEDKMNKKNINTLQLSKVYEDNDAIVFRIK